MPQSFCIGNPAALLTLPCTMKELAALWFRSAISSVLSVPSVPILAAFADWLTLRRWYVAGRAAAGLVAAAAFFTGGACVAAGFSCAGSPPAGGVAVPRVVSTAVPGSNTASSAGSESNFSATSSPGAPYATPTSRVSFAKPSISAAIVHVPSAKSAKENTPRSSVVVTIFCSPRAATTVTPGTGTPALFTVP